MDDFVNDTTPMYSYDDWAPYDRAAAALSFLLATAIISLNSLVIFTLVCRERKKSRLFLFILHLAIADLLVGVVCCLGDGIESAMHGAWYGGDVLCRIWRYSKFVLLMASNNLLIGMSVDRFIAVRFPLNFVRRGMCAFLDKTMVIGAWILGIVAPSWIIFHLRGVNGTAADGGGCFNTLQDPVALKAFVLAAAVVIVLVPLVSVTICYIGISIVIWRKWREGLELYEMTNDPAQARLHDNQSTNVGLLPKAKIKTIKMTFVICLAFLCCWLPYFVCTLLDVNSYQWPDQKLYLVLGYLYPLNSACNPLIVILFNHKLFGKSAPANTAHCIGNSTQLTTS